MHLAGDEAYYWDWGRRPALGYYSKPAMIAWIYALVEWIGGNLFAVRFTAILFGTLSLIMTWLLTRKLFDARTGFFAVLLALAVPGNCLLNFVLTIDAPLVLAWSLSLWFLWKFATGEQPGLSLFLLFVCLTAGHLSKQMMLFFPPLALAFLATGAETRPLLKKPGIWLALIGSFIGWLPLLYWNSQNGWITFNHMSSHIGAHAEPSLWETLYERVETFLEFFLSQLGALSPVIAVLIFMLTVLPFFTKRWNLTPEYRFLIIFCGAPLLLILVAAFFQKIQPNWPAVLYLAGIPMVAAWFSKAVDWYPVSDKSRDVLWRIGLGLGFALCAFFYFGPVVFALTGNEGNTADPNRRMIGSGRLGKAVHEIRQTVPGWEDDFIIASGHRYQAAWLGFELPDHPEVYRLAGSRIESQYEVWPGPWEDGKKGQNAFYVTRGTGTEAGPLVENAFEKVEFIKSIEVKFGSGMMTYSIFHCTNLRAQLRPDIPNH